MAFCIVQQTVKCSKVNNGCDNPYALCTTLYLHGINGLRGVILARGMSYQTSWITRHKHTMVCGGGSRDLIWQSVDPLSMLDGAQDCEYAGQASVWTAFDLDKSCVWHDDGAQDCEYAGQASVWTEFDLDKSCVWHDDGAQDCEYAGQASVWTEFDLDKSCVWHDDGAQDCEYAGQASVWTAFDLDKSCVWQIEKRKALYCHPVEPCSTPLNIQDGASFGRRKSGVNYL